MCSNESIKTETLSKNFAIRKMISELHRNMFELYKCDKKYKNFQQHLPRQSYKSILEASD